MKLNFKFSILSLAIVLVAACTDNSAVEPEATLSDSEFFKQNISIFDARVRSTSETQYVKEMYLKNFSGKAWGKTSIGFEGQLFEDNGAGNDLVAGDGIFTSVDKFNHSANVPFVSNQQLRSVLEAPIVSPSFTKRTELEEFAYSYELNRSSEAAKVAGPVATLECDVELCSTGCIADWIWDGFGCVCVSNCRAKIGWE